PIRFAILHTCPQSTVRFCICEDRSMDAVRRKLLSARSIYCRSLVWFAWIAIGLAADHTVLAQTRSSQPRASSTPRTQSAKASQNTASPPAASVAPAASSPTDATTPPAASKSAEPPVDDQLKPDSLAARIKELEAAADETQPDRGKILELYHQAETDLKS